MNSVYLKNCLLLAGLVLLSFFVFLVSFAIIIRGHTIQRQQADLEAHADAVELSYNLFVNFNPNRPEYHQMVARQISIVTLPGNHMVVANSRGVIVACSETYPCDHVGLVIPQDLRDFLAVNDSFAALTTIPGLVNRTSYVHARPILATSDGTHGGYVLVSSGTDVITAEWGAMVSIFLLVAASVVLMAIVLAMIVARHQAQPLREMSMAATNFANGDFSVRVEDSGRQDEIGELALAFNAMADSIEQSENMRREFVSNVSHELKTPMTSITGFAEGILDGTIPPQKQKDYLEIVASETRRLSRLVLRMLEVSRFQAMDIRELSTLDFDLSELLRRCLLSLEGSITEKGLDVVLNLPENPVIVLGDSDSIMQVAYNLLDNAAKFAYTNSVIEVSLTTKAGKAQVRVKNRGENIPADELPLLFNRFHKNDKSRSQNKDGIGLGLYIVKTIINAHREEVYVRSEQGVTEFMFTLTLAPKKKKKADHEEKG